MQRRGDVAKAAKKYKEEKKTGEILSEELKKIQEKHKLSDTTKASLIETADEAFRVYKEKYEDSIKIVDPGIEPIGQNVLLTCSLYSLEDAGRFLVQKDFSLNAFKEITESLNHIQQVIAVGPQCNQVKKGDTVCVDIDSFVRVKNPNSVKAEEVNDIVKYIQILNGRNYLLVHERSLLYVKR
jgi:hypothetical protein